MNDLHVAVISARRPGAPSTMAPFLEGLPPATWYVPDEEVDDYARFADIVTDGGDLITARNRALDDAAILGVPCLQLSDDLTSIRFYREEFSDTTPITVAEAVTQMIDAAEMTGAMLAGVAPTSNAFYASGKINDHGFCVGDMILVRPNGLRFDPNLRLKEDYDYTAQHLRAYGKVARCDWILATFKHRSNRGGAVAYRTPEVEQEAIAYLKAKWPGVITDNPKRPDEVLFRWKQPQPSFL